MVLRSLCMPLLLACLLALLPACAPRQPLAEPPAMRWSEAALSLRHAVTLQVEGQDTALSFDGLLAYSPASTGYSVRVVGLGGMGLTLFDMQVTPVSWQTKRLHPSIKHIPQFEENVAECIRALCLAVLGKDKDNPTGGASASRFVRKEEASGGGEFQGVARSGGLWSVQYGPQHPWPEQLRFTSQAPAYTVTVRLVSKGAGSM